MNGSAKLKCPDTLSVEPSDACVRLPSTVYHFTYRFRGDRLVINGRESEGSRGILFFGHGKRERGVDGWVSGDCTMNCPSAGTWRVVFWLDGELAATQTVVAGADNQEPSEVDTAGSECRGLNCVN
jgi:hypothetical protein